MQTEQFEIVVILEGIVETTGKYSDFRDNETCVCILFLPHTPKKVMLINKYLWKSLMDAVNTVSSNTEHLENV